jgi:hypothetical protein
MTKYRKGKQRKVNCIDNSYVDHLGNKTAWFYFDDTGRLGQFTFIVDKGNEFKDFRNLFRLFNVPPPAKLGHPHRVSTLYWYNLDDYCGFTRIVVAGNPSGFKSIDFYIDRID